MREFRRRRDGRSRDGARPVKLTFHGTKGETPDGVRIGHVSVKRQLEWCEEIGVPRMIVTHCGSQIVKGDEGSLGPRLARLGAERGVEAEIAHDGMEIVLR